MAFDDSTPLGSLQQRIEQVRARVATAAKRAGRAPESVQLIAVSKRQPAERIREAYAHGIRDFGENYVQEWLHKAEALSDLTELRWHLIGHLQRNKARQVAKRVDVVHTLDNSALVQELSRRLSLEGRSVRGYIEVNVGEEAQKSGCRPTELAELIRVVREHPSIELVGLMTVGPLVASAEDAIPTFVQLRQLRDQHAPELPRLSMGMSGDFEAAIAQGATDVRVGTAIFGERV